MSSTCLQMSVTKTTVATTDAELTEIILLYTTLPQKKKYLWVLNISKVVITAEV